MTFTFKHRGIKSMRKPGQLITDDVHRNGWNAPALQAMQTFQVIGLVFPSLKRNSWQVGRQTYDT